MNESCITGASPTLHCGAAACCAAPYDCCATCPLDCNSRCGWLDDEDPPEKEVQSDA